MTQKGFGVVVFVILSAVLISSSAILLYFSFKNNKAVTSKNLPVRQVIVPSPISTPTQQELQLPSSSPDQNVNPKISAESLREIKDSINKTSYARVIVGIKGNEFTVPSFNKDDVKKKQEVSKLQDEVLNNLQQGEITSISRSKYTTWFAADVTESGLKKLLNDPKVEHIGIDKVVAPT